MDNYMRILIDAYACPVYRIVEKIAKESHLPVILFSDSSGKGISRRHIKVFSGGAVRRNVGAFCGRGRFF